MKTRKTFWTLSLLTCALLATGCGPKRGDTSSVLPDDSSTSILDDSSNPGTSIDTPATDDVWTVTFDYNYEMEFKTYLTESVKDKEKVSRPADPIRSGYDFQDWFRDPYCREAYRYDFDSYVRHSMTLYALWERNGDPIDTNDYVITYSAGLGASFVPAVDGETLPHVVEYGTAIQFRVKVDTENGYTGTPIVHANGIELTPTDGVYTYSVVSNVTLAISGISKESTGSYRIYYENSDLWTSVYAYMWASETVFNKAWPGDEMLLDGDNGFYYYEFDSADDVEYLNVIFNDGGSHQTADLALNISFATGATLYAGSATNPTASAFDPKSTTASIVWTTSEAYQYEAVGSNPLPTSIAKGETVSFTINVNSDYEGTPEVIATGATVSEDGGVYTLTITGVRVTVRVLGLHLKGVIELYFTIPTWTPPVTNPKIYYWGEDGSGNAVNLPISWSDPSDPQGAMTLVSEQTYCYTISLDENNPLTIQGLVVAMYQDGALKQSIDITTTISGAGSYTITFVNTWVGEKFTATIAPR